MNDVFADTHYFIAVLNGDDEAHLRAVEATAQRRGRLVTTAWVLTELANSLHRPPDRLLFVETLAMLRTDPDTVIVSADQELFEAGVERFAQRLDQSWSLTDCISFVVMERMGLNDALTGDHHHEQAGFRALLKGPQ